MRCPSPYSRAKHMSYIPTFNVNLIQEVHQSTCLIYFRIYDTIEFIRNNELCEFIT